MICVPKNYQLYIYILHYNSLVWLSGNLITNVERFLKNISGFSRKLQTLFGTKYTQDVYLVSLPSISFRAITCNAPFTFYVRNDRHVRYRKVVYLLEQTNNDKGREVIDCVQLICSHATHLSQMAGRSERQIELLWCPFYNGGIGQPNAKWTKECAFLYDSNGLLWRVGTGDVASNAYLTGLHGHFKGRVYH